MRRLLYRAVLFIPAASAVWALLPVVAPNFGFTHFEGANQNANGSLVKNIETGEYKAALAYLRELVELGYVSPDVKSSSVPESKRYLRSVPAAVVPLRIQVIRTGMPDS